MERIFVGEKRSEQAINRGYSWEQGVSTAKFLFNALKDIGIEPTEQIFVNLWEDDGHPKEIQLEGVVVGMGQKVCAELTKRGIEHIEIVHPAARGKYKKKDVYRKHLREKLT